MKKGYFLAVAVMLTLLGAGCETEKQIAVQPEREVLAVPAEQPSPLPAIVEPLTPEQTPRIVFDNPVHDFGPVGPGSSNSHDFTFTNTGSGVLRIDRFHAPCGCTVPQLAKKEYAPGESGTINVRYTAPGGKASDNKPIYIYTNDPKNPQYELTVKAQVDIKVAISPTDVSLLLDQENAGMPQLVVSSSDGKEFGITSITVSNQAMRIPFDTNVRSSRIVLDPIVDMDKVSTAPTGTIQVRTTHPQGGTVMTRFSSKPYFEVSRPRIILQNILPGEELVRDVWIRSNYDQKVKIESFSSTNGLMTIESQQEEGNHLQIMVKITAPTDASRRYITDELQIHLSGGHKVKINCSGWFRLN